MRVFLKVFLGTVTKKKKGEVILHNQYLLACQRNRHILLLLLYNSLIHKSPGVNLEWAVELHRKVIIFPVSGNKMLKCGIINLTS